MRFSSVFRFASTALACFLLLNCCDDAAGQRHGHGHGHHHHNHGGKNFFGIGPSGITYGYSDGNFGIVLGPFGGGNYGGHYGGGYGRSYNQSYYRPPVVHNHYNYSQPIVEHRSSPPVVYQSRPATTKSISHSKPVANNSKLLPIIATTESAKEFQLEAEQAFYAKEYERSAQIARHAIVEDFNNGKLHLFNSQVLFAIGEYEGSLSALQMATQLLERDDWGYLVENFRNFYSNSDYVKHMDALVAYNKENPESATCRVLRGYHYLYLGHPQSAQKQLQRALKLDPENALAIELSRQFEEIPAPAPDEAESVDDSH